MKLNHTKLTLLIFSGLCIISFAFFTIAQENPHNDKNIFLDSDQDGLSDEEEKTYGTDANNRDTDGDGYTDGAEVRGGYDPLKPAPGDKIIQSSKFKVQSSNENANDKNLTEELSADVANLINEKSSENKSVTLEDLDAVINKTTGEETTFDDLPEIDEKTIKIKKQNYSKLTETERMAKEKEDALEYLTAVSYILINNSPQKITEFNDVEIFTQTILAEADNFSLNLSDISYFKELAQKGEVTLEQIKDIEVPEKFLELHINGIKLAKYAVSLKDEEAPDSKDPVATIVELSKVQNLISLSIDFSEKLSSELSKLGITEIPIDL